MCLTAASTTLRRNVFDTVCKLNDLEAAVTAVYRLRGSRLVVAIDACAVLGFWPDWARYKTSATVWANIAEWTFNTVRTEGALITADACLLGIGRQIAVAQFTVWTNFQHGCGQLILTPGDSSAQTDPMWGLDAIRIQPRPPPARRFPVLICGQSVPETCRFRLTHPRK